jgi:hypothetical protein
MKAPAAPSASTATNHEASANTSGAGMRPPEGAKEAEDIVADMSVLQ